MATLYEQWPSSETPEQRTNNPESRTEADEARRSQESLSALYQSSLSSASLESAVLIESLRTQSASEIKKSYTDGLLTQYFSGDKLPSISTLSANADNIITNSLILLWLNNTTKYNKDWVPAMDWHTISEWIPYLTTEKCKFIQNIVWAKADGKFWAQSLLLIINALWWDVTPYIWKLSNSFRVDPSVLLAHRPTETNEGDQSNDVVEENIDSWVVRIFDTYDLKFDKTFVKSIKHNERNNTITVSTKEWSTTLSYNTENGEINYTNHGLFSLVDEWNNTYKLVSRKESFDATKTIFDDVSVNYDSTDIDSIEYDSKKWCYILTSWDKTCELRWDDTTNDIKLDWDESFHFRWADNKKTNLYLWTWEWDADSNSPHKKNLDYLSQFELDKDYTEATRNFIDDFDHKLDLSNNTSGCLNILNTLLADEDNRETLKSMMKLNTEELWKDFKLDYDKLMLFSQNIWHKFGSATDNVFHETGEDNDYTSLQHWKLVRLHNEGDNLVRVFEVDWTARIDDYRFDSVEAFFVFLSWQDHKSAYKHVRENENTPLSAYDYRFADNVSDISAALSSIWQPGTHDYRTFLSFLHLPDKFWWNYKLKKEDINNFAKWMAKDVFDHKQYASKVFHDEGARFEVDWTTSDWAFWKDDLDFGSVEEFCRWLEDQV